MFPVVYLRQPTYPFARLSRVTAFNVHRAWQLMEPSSAEFDTPSTDPAANSEAAQPGYVVEIIGDTAPWWGVLKPFEQQFGTPYIHWVAEDFLAQLDERFVPLDLKYDSVSSGRVFTDLLTYGHRQIPLSIPLHGKLIETGPPVTIDISNGTSVLSAVESTAAYAAAEFGVLGFQGLGQGQAWESPTYIFQVKLGRDRSQSVKITNAHIISGSYSIDPKGTPAITRVITAAQTRDAVAGYASVPLADGPFLANLHRPQTFKQGVAFASAALDVTDSLAERRARHELTAPRYGQELYELTLNTLIDWRSFQVGDYVGLRLAGVRYGQSVDRVIRITGMQPDEVAGELDIIAEEA
jgi:hypothetical protein